MTIKLTGTENYKVQTTAERVIRLGQLHRKLGKLHACLLTRRSCQELVGYCERHGIGQQLDKVVD